MPRRTRWPASFEASNEAQRAESSCFPGTALLSYLSPKVAPKVSADPIGIASLESRVKFMLDDFAAGAGRKFRFPGAPIEDYDGVFEVLDAGSSLAAA